MRSFREIDIVCGSPQSKSISRWPIACGAATGPHFSSRPGTRRVQSDISPFSILNPQSSLATAASPPTGCFPQPQRVTGGDAWLPSCRHLRMLWGVHPMARCQVLNYSHRMNQQHYFQSQKSEDSAHLGSIHVPAPVKTPNHNQRNAVVKPSHADIARRAYPLFSASGSIPGHDVEHWLRAEAQLTVA